MWMSFVLAALASALILYLPGFVLLRAACLPRTWALATAPLPSIALVALVGEVLRVMGVSAGPLSVLGPALVVGGVALAIRFVLHASDLSLPRLPVRELVVAALLGMVVCTSFFVGNLVTPQLIFPSMDIVHHINVVRAFLDSGCFTSVAQDAYMTSADLAIDPYPGTSFYPSAWHALCALSAQATGASVPVALNALNYVTGCLVFPLACCPLWALIFGEQPRARALAAAASVSFAIFPWALFVFGPIFPNLLGFAVVPAEVWLGMRLFSAQVPRRERVTCLALAGLGVVALGLLHPNTVFTCAVWLAPYLVLRAYQAVCAHEEAKVAPPRAHEDYPLRPSALAVAALVATALVGIWVVCLNLPFFQSVLSSVWESYASKRQALSNVLMVGYTRGFWPQPHLAAQPVLAALLLLGVVRCFKEKQLRWTVVAYGLGALAVVASSSIEPPLKNWISGFWYTDPFRVGSMAAIFGMPLVALGLDWLCELVDTLIVRRVQESRASDEPAYVVRRMFALPSALLLALCAVGVFIGNFPLPGGGVKVTAFGALADGMQATYGLDDLYSLPERAFVERAMDEIPEGAVVANYPYDGSLIAYGASGLRCYWRFVYGYGEPLETPQSVTIREHLAEVATNAEVRAALADEGIEYLLLLHNTEGSNSWFVGYDHPELFDGLRFINDDTPGFETVLAEGDMRLYKIVA